MDNGDKTIVQLYKEHKGKVSDKWTRYLFEYDLLFEQFQDKPVRMLEIGVQNGGGLEIWAEYFKNGKQFIGCDINPDCANLCFEDPRIKMVVGDANHSLTQEKILTFSPELDIVNDDGSHRSSDIIKSFLRYFPSLTDGGIYVVEDLHASYWKEYEGGLFDPYSSMAFFKRLVDIINCEHWGIERNCADILAGFRNQYGIDIQAEILEHIHAIKFVNSLCVIQKAPSFENKLGGRVVAGDIAAVTFEVGQFGGISLVAPTQAQNPWSMRTLPPEEELLEREQEVRTLTKQIEEKKQAIQALIEQEMKDEQNIRTLVLQIAEKEKNIQILSEKIADINQSIGWRVVTKVRQFREILAPMDSIRGHLLLLLMKGLHIWRAEGIKSIIRKINQTLNSSKGKVQNVIYFPGRIRAHEPWLPAPSTNNIPWIIPTSKNPLISIVVVSEKLNNTRLCLASLIGHGSDYEFNIVVVADGVDDQANVFLSSISGIMLIRNSTHKGFAASCNAGAAVSQGQYLLFLRDEIVLQPNCVNELVRTILENEDCGLVGAKLIDARGILLEAGGNFQNNRNSENQNSIRDASAPANNYLRAVEFSTSAIAVSRKLVSALGGFDEKFDVNTEADFGLALEHLGYKNYYQPLACAAVIGQKVPSQNEYELLRYKWSEKLIPNVSTERKAVLFIDALTPTPDKDAGSVDVFTQMRLLISLGFHVTFASGDNLQIVPKYTADLQRIGVECLYLPYVQSLKKYIVEAGKDYDLVILARAFNAIKYISTVKQHCSHAKVIFSTVDLHFLRETRRARIEKSNELMRQAKDIRSTELGIMKKADCTLVVSSWEKDLLQSELPGINIVHMPLIVDITHRKQVSFSDRKDIFFVGGFQHRPNVDAMQYFVKDIWPLIRQRLPGVKFYIVGSHPPQEVVNLALEDVIIIGYKEDISEYFNNCRLSVAPVRYGAGLKGKVVHSLGYGLPVVATPIAAEGSGLVDNEHISIANDAISFAEAVTKLYTDEALWHKRAENGLAFFKENYSIAAGKRNFANLLHDLGVRDKK
jgi:GT2 family glycosyltransferase